MNEDMPHLIQKTCFSNLIFILKKIFLSINIMITLPQVKMLAKQNNISFTGLNNDEIITLLIDKNIITTCDIFKQKIVVKRKNVSK